MTGTGHSILTLTSVHADKGLALRIACEDLGIPPSEVVAIGDSETDIEMFKVAGAGVAMGQASDAVKAAADWVTAAHTEDGAGRAIEEILAGRTPP
jgi:hydroxymethylpyrimidine pyrophosphatase-like HAD family hydrolase